jgi:hypothetical protein
MHRYGCLAFQAWSHIPVGVHWAVMPRIWCSACFGIVRVTLDKGHRDSITWTGAFVYSCLASWDHMVAFRAYKRLTVPSMTSMHRSQHCIVSMFAPLSTHIS